MKLTQNDIATIEQAHDYLLEKSKLRLDSPLLSNLRDLTSRLYKAIGTGKQDAYLITKEQILSVNNGETKLNDLFPDTFEIELEVGKWYKVSHNNGKHIHIYITQFITQKDFKCYGFGYNGEFFNKTDSRVFSSAEYEEVDNSIIHKLFKNEYLHRSHAAPGSSFHLTIYNNKFVVNGNIVCENGEWIESALNINSLMFKARELEKKHNLKITVTFE